MKSGFQVAKQAKDVGDKSQVERVTLLTELEEKYEQEALRLLLNSYGGRAFIRRLLNFCGMEAMAPTDPNEMIRYQGRRDVGLLIQKQCLTADRDGYSFIAEESQLEETEE